MLLAKRSLLLAFFLCMGIALAYAQEPAGEMEVLRGLVKITRQNKARIYQKLGQRVPVFIGDRVHSGGNTRAKLFFRDDRDEVQLYSNTLFNVDEVSREKSRFGLNIGKAFFRVLSRFKKNRFSVRTPTATIGVKGTEFIVGTSENATFMLTVTGVVGVSNNKTPELEITVTANQATTVEGDSPPAPPVEVDPETRQDIISGDDNEVFEDLPFEVPPPPEPEQTEDEEAAELAATVEVVKDEIDQINEVVSETIEAALPSGDVGITTTPVDITIGR